MLSRRATLLLTSLRETAFGAVEHDAVSGERWTATDASYAMHARGAEDQHLDVTPEFFRGLLDELIAQGSLLEHESGEFRVILKPLSIGTVKTTIEEKEPIMFDMKSATMTEIVSKYNELSDKPVKKFADRKTAESRLSKLLPAKKAAAKAPKAAKAPRAPKVAKPSREAERKLRHSVEVNGKPYRSVAEAFKALSLPMGKHIAFRGDLKSSPHGRLAFAFGKREFDFKVIPFIRKEPAPKAAKAPKAKKAAK